jgi:hypothetical protein
MLPLADREISSYESMKADASNEEHNWQDLAEFVAPRKSDIVSSKSRDIEEYSFNVHDTEAIHANNTLAAGQMDYMVSGRWFDAEPPDKDAPQDVRDWYRKCAEIALEILQETNFDLEIHEFFKDRSAFGTAMIHLEADDGDTDDAMFFSTQTIGTFYCAENAKGLVDTVRRCIKMTCMQFVDFCGEEAMPASIANAYYSNDPGTKQKKFDIIHTMRPRRKNEREDGKIDGANKPWASIYVSVEDKAVVRNSGYDEQPFSVTRFEKWGDSAYGWSPGHMVIATIRQLQNIERDMDAVSEVQAFPRTLVPKGAVGKVRMEAAGVTVWDPGVANGQKPEEWATAADPRWGLERAEKKREMIRREYFVDLFQMLTNLDESKREKTAYEVSQMLHEKLSRISPTFARIKMEVFKPMLQRIFSILYRAGKFPEPPPAVLRRKLGGELTLPTPKFVFTSKLAMAIKSMENLTFLEWWQMMSPIAEVLGPEEFAKNLNFTRLIRLSGENQGVTVDFFISKEEMEEVAKAMEAQQQLQQGMELAQAGSQVASNMQNMPPALLAEMGMTGGVGAEPETQVAAV